MNALEEMTACEIETYDELTLLRHLENLTTIGEDAHALPLSARPYFVYCWDAPGPCQSWRVGRWSPEHGWMTQRPRDSKFPYTSEGEKEALRLAVRRNIDLARRIGHRWNSEFLADTLVPITYDD